MSSLVWVEIDGKAPEHNMKERRKGSATGTAACAVVKSNAYGHGLVETALAKLRLFEVPQVLGAAFILAATSIGLHVVGGLG